MAHHKKQIEHALVMVEKGAVPFCHYDNPYFHTPGAPQWMAESLLKDIVGAAEKNDVALTFLFGKHRPPANLLRPIESVQHVKIVPASLSADYPVAMAVISAGEPKSIAALPANPARNLILRAARRDLPRLAAAFDALEGKFGRLGIHLLELEYFTATDLETYTGELEKIAVALKTLYAAGHRIEVNVLTDRMMLTRMRNCDAGETHITVAPDGKLYICPAFFCDGEPAIGTFGKKRGFDAKPPSTVEFRRAPLCTRCDAWHCKRCVWLNNRLTMEYNVPSEQQCLIAHAEREVSRLALKAFGNIEPFRRLPRIVELNYRDPLELIEMPPVVFGRADDPML